MLFNAVAPTEWRVHLDTSETGFTAVLELTSAQPAFPDVVTPPQTTNQFAYRRTAVF